MLRLRDAVKLSPETSDLTRRELARLLQLPPDQFTPELREKIDHGLAHLGMQITIPTENKSVGTFKPVSMGTGKSVAELLVQERR
jgi:hypothetical protein